MDDQPRDPPDDTSLPENPFQSPTASVPSSASFSLLTVFLIMTLICSWLGLTYYLPGIGAIVLCIAVPALLRTFWIRRRRRVLNVATGGLEKVGLFFASLGIVTIIATSTVGAFCAICYPLGYVGFGLAYNGNDVVGGGLMISGWLVGFVVGGFVLLFTVRWLWKLGA